MTPRGVAPLGAHLSVAGGLNRVLDRAAAVGAEVAQVFLANPRAWAPPAPDPDGDARFAAAAAARRLPVFVHAPYLINFGSPVAATLTASAAALDFSLRRGAAVGARGVVLHAGSAVTPGRHRSALAQVREHLLRVLDAVPAAPPLLVEPTAGGGAALAASAASLADYLDALGRDERVGVCLDTCHMHAAGHDLSSPAGFAAALRAYARAAGPRRIGLVHVNDSRDPAGSRRDRHEAIGSGSIGAAPFATLFASPAVRGVPLVVETDEAGHAADLATLRGLRPPAAAGRRR